MISLVMATYNGSKYIIEQLDSIRKQSLQPDEVLIFDDKSTDVGFVNLLREYISKYKLKSWKLYTNTENVGWKKNFINAMREASGNIIFLADQDDIWDLSKIEIMYNAMMENSEMNFLCCNYNILNETGKRIRSNSTQKSINDGKIEIVKFDEKFHLVGRPGCTYCIRKDFIDRVLDAWNEDYAHDKLLWNAAMILDKVYRINLPLIKFRRHGDNASSKGTILDRNKRLQVHNNDIIVFNNLLSKGCIDSESKKYTVINDYKEWINARKELLTHKKICNIIRCLKEIKFYSSFASFIADIISK